MSEVHFIIGVAAGAFVGTNLDNLLLLIAMYARYERHPGTVTAGYFASMILIGLSALVIGKVGDFIPLGWLDMLGVVPLMMGVLALWKLFRKADPGQVDNNLTDGSRMAIMLTMVSTQISDGTDTIITFTALLADSSDKADYLILPTYLAMIGVFSALAYYSLKHTKLGQFLGRYGQYVTPVILILVGFYILSNSATDLVPG